MLFFISEASFFHKTPESFILNALWNVFVELSIVNPKERKGKFFGPHSRTSLSVQMRKYMIFFFLWDV